MHYLNLFNVLNSENDDSRLFLILKAGMNVSLDVMAYWYRPSDRSLMLTQLKFELESKITFSRVL